jgi:hypothetical protein
MLLSQTGQLSAGELAKLASSWPRPRNCGAPYHHLLKLQAAGRIGIAASYERLNPGASSSVFDSCAEASAWGTA